MKLSLLAATLLLLALAGRRRPAAAPQRGFAFGQGRREHPALHRRRSRSDGGVQVRAGHGRPAEAHAPPARELNRWRSRLRASRRSRSSRTARARLPDVAATFIRVGARTVRVHGACVARYTKLWNALAADAVAVRALLERSAARAGTQSGTTPPSTNHGASAMRAYASMCVRVPARPTASRAARDDRTEVALRERCVDAGDLARARRAPAARAGRRRSGGRRGRWL